MGKTNFTAEPGKQEVIITREFDAPRERLFQAYTDPSLIVKWWSNTTVDKMEVRPGGIWRYVSSDPKGGNQFVCHGVYHEITSPERLVYTFEAEGSGHVQLITITLEDRKGKTLFTQQSVFTSVEERDAMAQYGMEAGASAGLDRLEAVVMKG